MVRSDGSGGHDQNLDSLPESGQEWRDTPNTTLTGRERRDDVLWRIMHRMKSSLSPTFLVLHGFLTSAGTDRDRGAPN